MKKTLSACCLVLTLLASACSGGGSNTDNTNTDTGTGNVGNTNTGNTGGQGNIQASANLSNKQSPFGITPGAINYYSSEDILIDAFKRSGHWLTQVSGTWDTKEQNLLDLDEHGWVKSLQARNGAQQRFTRVAKLIYHDTRGHHPQGAHIVLYDGEGELEYHFDAHKDNALSAPGRDIVQVGGGSFMISIKRTNAQNHLRNIRVIKPGGICNDDPYHFAADSAACQGRFTPFEKIYATQIFHPVFFNELKHYGVIRGMVLQETPSNLYTNWQQRPKIADASWSGSKGAPFEILVTYANIAQTDLWVNIPARVDDDYVRRMAAWIRDNLDSNRTVYTEYFDEAWNQIGSYASVGGNWMQANGLQKWPNSNKFEALLNWYGMRTSEICGIFKQTFGADAQRVKCTLNSQAANSWVSEQMLACPLHVQSGGQVCAHNLDYLGIAPYFGGYLGAPASANTISTWSLDKVFHELSVGGDYAGGPQGGALAQSRRWMQASKQVANKYNVGMVAYEGGQHLSPVGAAGNNRDLVALLSQANRDSRMYDLYLQHFKDWKDSGGELFVAFVSVSHFGRYGSWGNKEYSQQDNTPKARAVTDFQSQNPCWWNNCVLK